MDRKLCSNSNVKSKDAGHATTRPNESSAAEEQVGMMKRSSEMMWMEWKRERRRTRGIKRRDKGSLSDSGA